jgi:hypothetical protein
MKFKELPFKRIAIVLYILSLFLPAIGSKAFGFSMVYMGLVSFFFIKTVPLGICWLANVFFWINLNDIKKQRKAKFGYSLTAILLGLLFLFIRLFYSDTKSSMAKDITSYINIGYFVWMLSFVSLLLYDLFGRSFDLHLKRKPRK